MNQKNLVAILGVVAVILAGTIIYFATISNVGQPAAVPVAQAPTPKVAQPSQGIVYANAQYGFQLTLPDSWEGYIADSANVNGELDVAFNVGGKNGFNIFSLYSAPVKEKNNVDIPAQGCIVGQTDKIVVLSSDCCKGVEATAQTDPFDAFQKARCAEVPAILKTFQLTK